MKTKIVGIVILSIAGMAFGQDIDELLLRSKGSPGAAPTPPVATIVETESGRVIRGRNVVSVEPMQQVTPEPTPQPTPEEATESAVIPQEPVNEERKVWTIDPASPMLQSEQTKGTPYEPTSLYVNRNLVALEVDDEVPGVPVSASKIPVNIPVIYQSRTIVWNEAQHKRARELVGEMEKLIKRTEEIPAQFEALATEWNALLTEGTPEAVLMADSPSLPSNEGDAKGLRTAEEQFQPGGGISVEVKE